MDFVEIADEDELYRRIASACLSLDGTTVTSVAYKLRGKPDNSISVDVAKLTSPESTLAHARPGLGIGILIAGFPRSLDFDVRHDPVMDNRAHALIQGDNNKEKCRRLAENTTILIMPEG